MAARIILEAFRAQGGRRERLIRLGWAALAFAACCGAGAVAVGTVRTVVANWSPLPFFDEWANVELLRAWQDGDMTALQVLFSQHNEHRLFVPRLVFFADDLLSHGEGSLNLAAIFLVQALHAGVFALVLTRARGPRAGAFSVGAAVVALMFGLRQCENFITGFQLQFVAVFAGATLCFALFGCAVGRARRGQAVATPLLLSFGTALLTSFTMANGLVAGFVLVATAVVARLPTRIVLACAGFTLAVTALYLHRYEPVAHHAGPLDSLRHPARFILYVAAYLGAIATWFDVDVAGVVGVLGIAGTLAAVVRAVRRRGGPAPSLAMTGVMLFVGAAAVITAAGRINLGAEQALSSRYATGSAAFWAAQLVYWWIDPPMPRIARALVAVGSAAFLVTVASQQRASAGAVAHQGIALREGSDLLLLGFHDDAVERGFAWDDAALRRLVPVLRSNGLSIFSTGDARALGRPVLEGGTYEGAMACRGALKAAADPGLGRDGVRVSGTAWSEPRHRPVRRIDIVDGAGRLVGLGSVAGPSAAWRGFALGQPGTALTAYAVLPGPRLCRLAVATVTAQLSQPELAP